MGGKLDEVSEAIGELKAGQKSLGRSIDRVDKKMGEVCNRIKEDILPQVITNRNNITYLKGAISLKRILAYASIFGIIGGTAVAVVSLFV